MGDHYSDAREFDERKAREEYEAANSNKDMRLERRFDTIHGFCNDFQEMAEGCPVRYGARCNLSGDMCQVQKCFGIYWHVIMNME